MKDDSKYFLNLFEEWSETYARTPGDDFTTNEKIKLIQKYASVDKKALEIGVASGLFTISAAPFFREVEGIDFSPKMIEVRGGKRGEGREGGGGCVLL